MRPRYVTVDDRRANAARAIALDPSVFGEGEAGKLFAKILHHVVALEFAMYKHVEANFLLPPHRCLCLAPQKVGVVGVVHGTAQMCSARFAYLVGLRKGSDCRRWKGR